MKIKFFLLALFALCFFAGCTAVEGEGAHPGEQYTLIGRVTEVGEHFLIEAEESEVAFGPYLVRTSNSTSYTDAQGKQTARDAISVGDRVLVTYSGQVMLSYPPQIVAYSITVL
jgi:hypothetical protein